MHRQPLQELLRTYVPTAAEREHHERILDFVQREPQCFERSCLEGHITGSAWILDAERKRTLLTHHRKLNMWLQPGGHTDGESDVAQVALREGIEESGIQGLQLLSPKVFDVDVHAIPARKADPEHFHFDVRFVLVAPVGAEYVVSEESHDLAWVSPAQQADYQVDGSVVRLFEKWCMPGADCR